MKDRRKFLGVASGAAIAALVTGLTATTALAQEVTLKLHQFLPAQANVPTLVLDVWADKVEADSDGRIKIDRYPSMQLGGKPPELIDQVIDGVADIIWTVNGYTPNRFPGTEVFELPFMMTDARATSRAYWEMLEKHWMDTDYKNVHLLAGWVHGPGVFHTNKPVAMPEDLEGMKIRGGSRSINSLLTLLGATPVGMPVPAIPEALSKGVVDGATIPWEVTTAMKVSELVHNHTEFTGNALYSLTFVLAMNKQKYDSLPDDLKQVIDDNSGVELSVFAGGTQADADEPARQLAVDMGNNIITVDAEQTQVWREASQPIYDSWAKDMEARGIDGQALIDEARALIDKYTE